MKTTLLRLKLLMELSPDITDNGKKEKEHLPIQLLQSLPGPEVLLIEQN